MKGLDEMMGRLKASQDDVEQALYNLILANYEAYNAYFKSAPDVFGLQAILEEKDAFDRQALGLAFKHLTQASKVFWEWYDVR